MIASGINEAASKSKSIHPMLLEPSVLDALEHACEHDFKVVGKSLAAQAAGTLVALVGRNEGGKTLSRTAIHSVMADLKANLNFDGFRKSKSLTSILTAVKNVATMAVSDTNKTLMLESEGAIETLVTGLLLSSPRRSEDGADALQEACAELILSLALHGPWAEVLRAHTGAMGALHSLRDGDLGTPASRRSAESTLFELEGRKLPAARSAAGPDGAGAKHVMISYCWDQQQVIKRVHAALRARSYSVWIE